MHGSITEAIAAFLKIRDEAGLAPDEMDDADRLKSARCIISAITATGGTDELTAYLSGEANRAKEFALRYRSNTSFREQWDERSRKLSEAVAILSARQAATDALAEPIATADEWKKWAFEWSGSAFVSGERLGKGAMSEAEHKSALYSDLCRLGAHMDWLADQLRIQAAMPVAWCQPMRNGEPSPRQFLVRFEDAAEDDAVFDDEAEARAFWQRANDNWNCYLFGALPLEQSAPRALPGRQATRDMLAEGRVYEVSRTADLTIRGEPFYSGPQFRAAYRHGYDLAVADALASQSAADKIIGQIEERFPDWRSYRDLIDCIDCTLHAHRS